MPWTAPVGSASRPRLPVTSRSRSRTRGAASPRTSSNACANPSSPPKRPARAVDSGSAWCLDSPASPGARCGSRAASGKARPCASGFRSPRPPRRYPSTSQTPRDRQSILIGEADVEQHDVGRAVSQQRRQLRVAAGLEHIPALLTDLARDQIPDLRVIVDDKDLNHAGTPESGENTTADKARQQIAASADAGRGGFRTRGEQGIEDPFAAARFVATPRINSARRSSTCSSRARCARG